MNLQITKPYEYFLFLDIVAWSVFGLLWYFYPARMLSANTNEGKFNSVSIHMTRAFAIFLFVSVIPSYYALLKHDKMLAKFTFMCKFNLFVFLLLTMIYDNYTSTQWDHKQYKFGMFGLTLAIVNVGLGRYFI